MKEKFEYLCKGNKYTTTIHGINSALLKLAKLQPATDVFCGVRNGLLPEIFWKANEFIVKSGVEFVIMSTTTNRDVAVTYSGAGENNSVSTIIQGQLGMIDRGAELSWLSQYPAEKDIYKRPGALYVHTTVCPCGAVPVQCESSVPDHRAGIAEAAQYC
jgi:hypothetical protein